MSSKRSYVNYHKHDHVSSIFTPDTPFKAEDFIKRAIELGDKVYFTTNHGSGGDIFEAKTLCDKYELKCLFGMEGYIVPDPLEKDKRNYHIIIIPTTDEARKKVNYVSSHANIDGYYYKPRIFIDDLLALDKDDVYITTACVAGILRDEDSTEKIFIPLANHFGDHMFAEVQAHNVQIQKEHNKKCLEIAEQYGIRLIAATDSHYIHPAQSKDRDLYLKGKGVYYEDEEAFILDYPDGDTLYKRFVEQGVLSKAQIEDAMRNTFLFADCEEVKIDKEIKMPTIYPNLSSEEKVEELRRHVERAFEKIKEQEHIPEERLPLYRKRIDEEMKVVEDTASINMADYFLLNEEIVRLATNKYGGVLTRTGRGSSPSYFLNKLLGMTQIDALTAPVPVYSSRFISTARCLENRSMADIDYNVVSQKPFQDASKELLGEHGCYPMVAYGTMELSEAFRNTCRASELPYAQYNDIAKAVESHAEEPKWKPYIDEAKTFIGSIVSVSPHPCAHILMDKDLRYEYGVVRVGDALCVMITSSEADEYKVLKDDFLIVSVWKLISETFEMLGKPIMTVKELEENLDDKVWNLFRDGITATLNQVDGSWATDLAKQYKIHSVREAAMFTAALRPSFDSWRTKFINREKYSTGCEQLDEVLKPTGSYILFQENLMQFFEWLGVTPAESIGLIKKISKKKIKQEDFDSLEGRLHKQWIANVGNDDKFKDVWDMIQSCISYGFCISGDTVLNRVGYRQCTVEELYNKCDGDYGEGYSLCDSAMIKNTIEDIHFTGIRETYRITLNNLAHIDCTANHKFPTPNGIFETKDLHIGDALYNVVGERCDIKLQTNKITSIMPVGKKRVYSVTMAHPNHTYVANGIVTCNCSAHGLATGLDMLYGAYLKSHYPCEYYTVCLNTYKEKHGKVSILISEMKYFGVKLLPPNINKSRQDFTASNGNILYGLSGIVGVGNVFGDAIVAERDANGKFMNLNDFISRMKPSVSQMVALIKSGAVPTKDKEKMLWKYFKMSLPEQKPYKPVSSLPSKAKLLLDYNIDVNVVTDKEERLAIVNSIKQKTYEEKQQETIKKKADEFSSKYMTNPEFWEFETLSVFLTDNPFEGVLPYINLMFADAADGQQCTIVGAVSGVTKKKDKNKNTFAFVNINSIEGFLELTCWAGQYKKYSDLLTRGQQLAVLVKKNQDKAIIQDIKPYRQWLADRKINTKRSKKEGG